MSLVDLALIAVAAGMFWSHRLHRREDIKMIGLFVPIAFTLFMAYSLIVQRLRRPQDEGAAPSTP